MAPVRQVLLSHIVIEAVHCAVSDPLVKFPKEMCPNIALLCCSTDNTGKIMRTVKSEQSYSAHKF